MRNCPYNFCIGRRIGLTLSASGTKRSNGTSAIARLILAECAGPQPQQDRILHSARGRSHSKIEFCRKLGAAATSRFIFAECTGPQPQQILILHNAWGRGQSKIEFCRTYGVAATARLILAAVISAIVRIQCMTPIVLTFGAASRAFLPHVIGVGVASQVLGVQFFYVGFL